VAARLDQHVVEVRDDAYPTLLRQIHDSPERLFVGGSNITILQKRMVALVGARSCSSYGSQVARTLARALPEAGAVIVSGLARGVDTEAHRGALDVGGATIAVLGCGIDVVYPARNRRLAERIREEGLLVSEYPDTTPVAPWRFPARNRIIAGVALATIVVEARERSGALITADFALDAGREVLAVPGEITSSRSAGTNALIRYGATPAGSISELVADLGFEVVAPRASTSSDAERRLIDAIGSGATTLDDLGRALDLASATLSSEITELELAGRLEAVDGHYRVTVI